jgi:hypothetical protein
MVGDNRLMRNERRPFSGYVLPGILQMIRRSWVELPVMDPSTDAQYTLGLEPVQSGVTEQLLAQTDDSSLQSVQSLRIESTGLNFAHEHDGIHRTECWAYTFSLNL